MTRRKAFLLAALLAALYVALLLGSLSDNISLVASVGIGSLIVDYFLRRTRYRRLLDRMARVGAATSWRFFYRQVLVLVFLLQHHTLSQTATRVLVIAVIVHHLALTAFTALRRVISTGRMRRMETRNLDIPGARLPAALPRWLTARGSMMLLHTEAFLLLGLVWAWIDGSYALIAPGAVAMVVAALALTAALVPQARRLRQLPAHRVRLDAAQQAVSALEPLVVLYFSGGTASVYQVNMWLETMERLERPVLVILRERRYLQRVHETSLPILCLPFAIDLMNFDLSTVRVSLFVANVGKNIHLLRVPTMMSAFIGHGDSDKTASFNPYAKVYDEVWVAGEAGRQRYIRAQVGVKDEDVVAVGRPQLDGIASAVTRDPDAPFTVLYAPTWEGWTNDPHASSLIPMGREIVSLLLAEPGVRVLYRPHPLNGTVKAEARAVSAEIRAMLAAAGPQHATVTARDLTLYQCFDESDALISDISSVVSDYLKSEKPYFVTNGAGVPAADFRTDNPSSGAAYLIGPAAEGLVDGLAEARTSDVMRAHRHEVRIYLLGPADVSAIETFRAATDRLAAKAERTHLVQRSGVEDDDERLQGDPSVGDADDADASGTEDAEVVGTDDGGADTTEMEEETR